MNVKERLCSFLAKRRVATYDEEETSAAGRGGKTEEAIVCPVHITVSQLGPLYDVYILSFCKDDLLVLLFDG